MNNELWFKFYKELQIIAFVDADYVGDIQTRRSTTNFFSING